MIILSGYFIVVYRETDNRSIPNVYRLNEHLADYWIRQGDGGCVCCVVVLTNDTASLACCTALIKLSQGDRLK